MLGRRKQVTLREAPWRKKPETVSPRCGLQRPEQGHSAGNTGGLGTGSVAGGGKLGGRREGGMLWGECDEGREKADD